jgi:hypothetical protein
MQIENEAAAFAPAIPYPFQELDRRSVFADIHAVRLKQGPDRIPDCVVVVNEMDRRRSAHVHGNSPVASASSARFRRQGRDGAGAAESGILPMATQWPAAGDGPIRGTPYGEYRILLRPPLSDIRAVGRGLADASTRERRLP